MPIERANAKTESAKQAISMGVVGRWKFSPDCLRNIASKEPVARVARAERRQEHFMKDLRVSGPWKQLWEHGIRFFCFVYIIIRIKGGLGILVLKGYILFA